MDEGIVTLTSFWSRVPVPSVVVVVVKSCSLVVVVLFTSPATVITLVGLTSISEKVIGELVVARLYITAELLTGTLVTVAFLYASCASLNVVRNSTDPLSVLGLLVRCAPAISVPVDGSCQTTDYLVDCRTH